MDKDVVSVCLPILARRVRRRGLAGWSMIAAGLVAGCQAGQAQAPRDLTQASLEDLLNMQITSVSKKEQKLSQAGAAVFVITAEDIRRSGATNVPDLLRMAPGVQVSQLDAGTWAISIRGFNDRYANKVLVLIDGRSVYSPDFSGVLWDQQDVPLDDIERIEVVRGTGGTIWGANAVNGVINIITKNSKETQGGWIDTNAGSQKNFEGLVQYGGHTGRAGAFRAFARRSNFGSLDFPDRGRAGDGWHRTHGGFRSDWDLTSRDSLTLEGDLLHSSGSETVTTLFSNALPLEQTLGSPTRVSTGNLMALWKHGFTNGSNLTLQTYWDRDDRTWIGIHDTLDIFDLDVNHHFKAGSRNDIVWGFGDRVTHDRSTPGYAVTLLPLYPTDNLANVFLQDEISLTRSLSLTLGAKLEHNTYTGLEYEPSAQLVWNAADKQTLWVSGARAIRQPARFDRALDIDVSAMPLPGGSFALVKILPSPNLIAEELRELQAGYRSQVGDRISFDFAAFLGFYSNLQSQAPGAPYFVSEPAPPHLVIPLLFGNTGHGHTYGGEVFANWSASQRWKVTAGYSYLHVRVSAAQASPDPNLASLSASAPKNQLQVRSFLNLTHRMDWDCSVAYVGALPDTALGFTPAYTRLDTRLGVHLGEATELSLVGQNLLQPRHLEFHSVYPIKPTEMERQRPCQVYVAVLK